MCDCKTEINTKEQFFLHCPFSVIESQQPLNTLYERHLSSQNLNEESVTQILLDESNKTNKYENQEIIFVLIQSVILKELRNYILCIIHVRSSLFMCNHKDYLAQCEFI